MMVPKNQWNLNGILIGLMLSLNVLSPLMSFIPNGIAVLILCPFSYLIYRNYKDISQSTVRSLIVFVTFIFLFFIYSLLIGSFQKFTIHYLFDFLLFGIPYLFLAHINANISYIFRSLTIIGIVAIPLQLAQIDFSDTSDAGTWMMVSYNIVKIAIASIISLFYDKLKLIKLVSVINILITIVFLTSLGSRGAILGCVSSLFLLFLYRKNKQLNLLSSKFVTVVLLIFLAVSSFSSIMIFVHDTMQDYNISSYSLQRIINSLNNGSSLSSGRDEIYAIALDGIEKNVYAGKGIASFDNFSGEYPHNLIIQMLYEGGLLLGGPLIILTFFSLFSINSKQTHQNRLLQIYLFNAGVVQLIFSSYFWMSILFWYWIGLNLKRIKF